MSWSPGARRPRKNLVVPDCREQGSDYTWMRRARHQENGHEDGTRRGRRSNKSLIACGCGHQAAGFTAYRRHDCERLTDSTAPAVRDYARWTQRAGRSPSSSCKRTASFSTAKVAALCIIHWALTSIPINANHAAAPVGAGVCRATGTTHFTVTCSDGGVFLDSNGRSAYKRCAPILCPPFALPENSVAVPITKGANPAKLKLGDEIEVKCNAGFVQRGPVGVTNRTMCSRNPVCTLRPTTICVYESFCPVSIDPHGVASAKWLERGNVTEVFGSRTRTAYPNSSYIFNREFVSTQCNIGYRSSLHFPAQTSFAGDGACPLNHSVLCREQFADASGVVPTNAMLETNTACIPVQCPPFNVSCRAAFCGPDFGKDVATVTRTNVTNLSSTKANNNAIGMGETVTIKCNQGYYLPISPSFIASCDTAYSAAGNLTTDYKQTWNGTCSHRCNYNAPPRPCEPLPCKCLQIPANAVSSRASLHYHESAAYTCNTGYAVKGTTAQECLKTQSVQCSFFKGDLSVHPALPSDHCSLTPCGRYYLPENAVSNQIRDAGVHGSEIIVTCNVGYRANTISESWTDCSNETSYRVQCDDCKWRDYDFVCKKVKCPAPSVVNGVVSSPYSEFGGSMTVTCNEGYRPGSTKVDVSMVKTVQCTDECAHSPQVKCLPVLSNMNFSSLLGNATYIGLSTWTGNLGAHETGLEFDSGNIVKMISLSYGGRATFVCNVGYSSSADETRCTRNITIDAMADGTLRGVHHYCKPHLCSGAQAVNAANVVPWIIEVGQSGTVTCAPGYRAGPKTRTFSHCRNAISYTIRCTGCELEADSVCLPVRCETTGSITSGSGTQSIRPDVSVSNILFQETVEVRCNPGYRIGTHDIQGELHANASCSDNCQLSRNLTCIPLSCDLSVVSMVNGKWAAGESGAGGMYYGESKKIVCNAGYNVGTECSRSFIVGCASDGSIWNSNKSCSTPTKCPAPDHSYSTITSDLSVQGALDYGATLSMSCNNGYGVRGSFDTYASCESMRSYTVQCSDDCSFAGGNKCAPYRCQLSELNSLLSGKGVVSHSLVDAAYYGDSVTITCNAGYFFGIATSRIKTIDVSCSASVCGSFGTNGSTSLCVDLNCDLNHLNTNNAVINAFPSNRYASSTKSAYGDSYNVTCNPGHILFSGGRSALTMKNRFTSTCGDTGIMSESQEYCIRTPCSYEWDPNAMSILLVSGPGVSSYLGYGDEVLVTCNNGYRASTSNYSTCTDSMTYVGKCGSFEILPSTSGMSCRRVICDGLSLIKNSLVGKGVMSSATVGSSANVMLGGDKIEISCNAGYTYGSNVSSMSTNTVACTCPWASDSVVCVFSACNVTNLINLFQSRNAMVTTVVSGYETSVSQGTTWAISCNAGHYLASSAGDSSTYLTNFTSTCGQDSLMTNLDQECKEITCPDEADSHQASQYPISGVKYGFKVNVTCIEGYKAVAVQSSAATCSDEQSYNTSCGAFSYLRPVKCRPIFCNLSSIHSRLSGKGFLSSSVTLLRYGESVNVTCNTGYRLGGQVDVRLSSFTCSCPWISDHVDCHPVQCDIGSLQNLVATSNATLEGLALTHNFISYGADVTVKCNRGFSVVDNQSQMLPLPSGTGEEECEFQDLDKLECLARGCCFWVESYDLEGCFSDLEDFEYCISAYDFAESFISTCGDDGLMTNLDRKCVPGLCPMSADANQAYIVPYLQEYYANNVYFGDIVSVMCDTAGGYRASASTSSFSTCDDEEAYNSTCGGFEYTSQRANMSCEPIVNLDKDSMQSSLQGKGFISSTEDYIQYGSSFQVTCNTGYRFGTHDASGPSSSTITYLCPWRPGHVNCSIVHCQSAFPPLNSTVVTGSVNGQIYPSFGSYTVQCDRGHFLNRKGNNPSNHVTNFEMTCGNDGVLTLGTEVFSEFHYCVPMPCNRSQADPHQKSQYPPSGSVQGDPVLVTCNDGYRASALRISSCNQSLSYAAMCDMWEVTPLEKNVSCERVFCDLQHLRSALSGRGIISSSLDAIEYDTSVEITCNNGYRIVGSSARKMILSCSCPWNVNHIKCSPVQCSAGALSTTAHAIVKDAGGNNLSLASSSTIEFGKPVTLKCDAGYYHPRGSGLLSDEIILQCGDDGNITNASIKDGCTRMVCNQPAEHGTYQCTSGNCDPVLHGDQLLVTCNSGFRASAASLSNCSDSMTYSASCLDFQILSTSGDTMCRPLMCTGINSMKSDLLGKGILISSSDDTLYGGSELNVSCNTGYRFRSSSPSNPKSGSVKCECNFNTSSPCELLRCNSSALQPAGAVVSSFANTWNARIHVQCNKGYLQANTVNSLCHDHFEMTCSDDGEWTSPTGSIYCVEQHTCHEETINCTLGHVAVSSSKTGTCSHGSSYLQTCVNKCTPMNDISCKPVECPIPLFAGTTLPSQVFFNQSLMVTCKNGHRFKSTDVKVAYVTCKSDCQFSESIECNPITCGASVLADQTALNIQSRVVDDLNASSSELSTFVLGFFEHVPVHCLPGHIVETSPPGLCTSTYQVNCIDDGSIHGTYGSLKCLPTFCDLRLLWNTYDSAGQRMSVPWNSSGAGTQTVVYLNESMTVIPSSPGRVIQGNNVLVACNTGYRISSHAPGSPRNASTSCLSSCTFEPALSCMPVACAANTIPPPNSYVSNNSVLARGQWPIDDSSRKLYFGETLNVTCNSGYLVASSPQGTMNRWFQVHCNDSGDIEGSNEECVPECSRGYRQCGSFNVTKWGGNSEEYAVISDSFPFQGDSISLRCAYGHRLALVTEMHGQCSRGSSLTAKCDNCIYTSPYRCRLSACEQVNNASTFSLGQIIHGGTGSLYCKTGYRASKAQFMPPTCTSLSTIQATCSDCAYATNAVQCRRIMCDISSIKASQGVEYLSWPTLPASASYVLYQDNISVSCLPGFRALSEKLDAIAVHNMSCMHNCQLSFTDIIDSPVCSPIACRPFSPPANSTASKSSLFIPYTLKGSILPTENSTYYQMRFGDDILVTCDAGYTRGSLAAPGACHKTYKVNCSEQGLILNEFEYCTPIVCSQYDNDPFLESVEVSNVTYGNSASVTCKSGYVAAPIATGSVQCWGSCKCKNESGVLGGVISDGGGHYWTTWNSSTNENESVEGYGNNEWCAWLISSDAEISLQFKSFNVEPKFDSIILRQCSSASCEVFEQLAILSGSGITGPYASSTGFMQVLFTSDGSVTDSGFEGEWSLDQTHSIAKSPASCSMSKNYTVTCNDWEHCNYTQPKFCKPVECPIPMFDGTSRPSRGVFNEPVVFTCKSAYRYKSQSIHGPKSHTAICNENCSLTEIPVCLPIVCNASWLNLEISERFGVQNNTFASNLSLSADENVVFHCKDNLIAQNSPPGVCQRRYDVRCVDDGSIESDIGSFQCIEPFCNLLLLERASPNWNNTLVYKTTPAMASGNITLVYSSFERLDSYDSSNVSKLNHGFMAALRELLGTGDVDFAPAGVRCNFTIRQTAVMIPDDVLNAGRDFQFNDSFLHNLTSLLILDREKENVMISSHTVILNGLVESKRQLVDVERDLEKDFAKAFSNTFMHDRKYVRGEMSNGQVNHFNISLTFDLLGLEDKRSILFKISNLVNGSSNLSWIQVNMSNVIDVAVWRSNLFRPHDAKMAISSLFDPYNECRSNECSPGMNASNKSNDSTSNFINHSSDAGDTNDYNLNQYSLDIQATGLSLVIRIRGFTATLDMDSNTYTFEKEPSDAVSTLRLKLTSKDHSFHAATSQISGPNAGFAVEFSVLRIKPLNRTLLSRDTLRVPGGAHLFIACKSGYRLNTGNVRGPLNASTTCDSSSCGFASMPVCMPVQCNAFSMPPLNAHITDASAKRVVHGNMNSPVWSKSDRSLEYGDILNISCNPLYMVEGGTRGNFSTWFLVGCSEEGGLFGTQRCVRMNCGEYLGDAKVISMLPEQGANSFEKAELTCARGYRVAIEGTSSVECSNSQRTYNVSCSSDLGYRQIDSVTPRVCTPVKCGHFNALQYNGGPRKLAEWDTFRLFDSAKSIPEYSSPGFTNGLPPGHQDGPSPVARLHNPLRMTAWPNENKVLLTDQHRIRVLVPNSGIITTLVGSNQHGVQDGSGENSKFHTPGGIAVVHSCSASDICSADIALVADSGNHKIRRVELFSLNVTTFAGSGVEGFLDGRGKYARFSNPRDVLVDKNLMSVFIADCGNHRIRKIDLSTENVTTFSGTSIPGFVDGHATIARFREPQALALSPDGSILFVADSGNHAIRAIRVVDGKVRTLAGSGLPGFADGRGIDAGFYFPSGLTLLPNGYLLVADTWNNRLRSVVMLLDNSTRVFTLSGTAGRGFLSEGTVTAFAHPEGVLVHGSSVFVADSGNNIIRNLSMIQSNDTRFAMLDPYAFVPNVASSIRGYNVSLECRRYFRSGIKGRQYAFCSAIKTANATCDDCGENNVIADYSGNDCLPAACDPIDNESHYTQEIIRNGNYGNISCQRGYRAISSSRAITESPNCSFPVSFSSLCTDCAYDMRSKESMDEWMTCKRVTCDLEAIRQLQWVASVVPDLPVKTVHYQDTIQVTCRLGYRPQTNNASSSMTVSTKCSHTCLADLSYPICHPVECPAWKPPNNSRVVGVDNTGNGSYVNFTKVFNESLHFTFPQKLKVSCDEGYKLASLDSSDSCQQEYVISCTEDGIMLNAEEFCIPIKCAMTPIANSFLPHNKPISYGQRTQAACETGYRPNINRTTIGCSTSQIFEMTCGQCKLESHHSCVSCVNRSQELCNLFEPSKSTKVVGILYPVSKNDISNSTSQGSGKGKGESNFAEQEEISFGPPPPSLNGSYNLSGIEGLAVVCPPGFTVAVPPLLIGGKPEFFTSGVFPVKCEIDGVLSRSDAKCECVPPAIIVDSPDSSSGEVCICPEGFYGSVPSDEYGAIECNVCPPNSWSNMGATSLQLCECNAGYYSEDVTDCKKCPEFSYSMFGSRYISDCLCAAGTYKLGSECRNCPGNSTSEFNSVDIDDCECTFGFAGNGRLGCKECSSVGSVWMSVQECDTGEHCTVKTVCECKAGYYGNGFECKVCPHGGSSWQNTLNVDDCLCPQGTYQVGDACQNCPLHSQSDVGSLSLSDCLCSEGFYLNNATCKKCPERKSSSVGSKDISDCVCMSKYRPDNGECRECSENSMYDVNLQVCACTAGYYMQGPVDDESSVCVACGVGKHWVFDSTASTLDRITYCQDCFQHSTTSGEGSTSVDDCLCLPGYSFPAFCLDDGSCGPCLKCPRGTYKEALARSTCEDCFLGSSTEDAGTESRQGCTCIFGYEPWNDGMECRRCAAGEFYNTNGTCSLCPLNSISLPGTSSCFCNAGFSPQLSDGNRCDACPAGKYKVSTGSGPCEECPVHATSGPGSGSCKCIAGYESKNGICSACPIGWYKSSKENTLCIQCQQQMSSAKAASTKEEDCQCLPGWFEISEVPINSKNPHLTRYCSACQSGHYKVELGAQACETCPPGSYSPQASIHPNDCSCGVGSSGNLGASNCSACAVGKYKSSPVSGPCTECPPPRSTKSVGSGSLDDCLCPAGMMPDPSNPLYTCVTCVGGTFKANLGSESCSACSITECDAGKYRSVCTPSSNSECTLSCTNAPENSEYTSGGRPANANNCEFKRKCEDPLRIVLDPYTGDFVGCRCKEGYEGEDSCTPCKPGTYKNFIGQAPCNPCFRGTYQNLQGQTGCTQCPFGAFTAVSSSSTLADCVCNAGFSGANGGTCTACAPGKYSPISSSSSCIACASGKFSPSSGSYECQDCVPNSVSNFSRCICNAGYEPSTERCVKCPSNMYKDLEGLSQCKMCSEMTEASPDGTSCLCKPGFYSIGNAPQGNCSACAPGSYSDAVNSSDCKICELNMYQDSGGQTFCKDCPKDSATDSKGSTSHCNCKCNAGFRWNQDINASRDSSYCPAETEDNPCKMYCSMESTDTYKLSPVSNEAMRYPIKGERAHLTCNLGHRLSFLKGCIRTTEVQCSGNGGWNKALDSACERIKCSFNSSDVNVLPAVTDVPYDTVLNVTCRNGFQIGNPLQPKPYCDDACRLRYHNVSCTPKKCMYNVSNARGIDLAGHPSNLTAEFPNSIALKCQEGFVSSANCGKYFFPTCQADETFSMQDEPCVVSKCGPPEDSFDNIVSITSQPFAFNHSVQLQCQPKYVAVCTIQGSKKINTTHRAVSEDSLKVRYDFPARCGESGCIRMISQLDAANQDAFAGTQTCTGCGWQSECQCVKKTCPPYKVPQNVTVTDKTWFPTKDFFIEEELMIQCMPGLQIRGTTTCEKNFKIKCDLDGKMEKNSNGKRFPGCEPVKCFHNSADLVNHLNGPAYVHSLDGVVLDSRGPTMIGKAVNARCRSEVGYVPADISVKVTCNDTCMFDGLPRCSIQKCDAYIPMSKDGMNNNAEIMFPTRKILHDSFEVTCADDYFVDDLSVLPGLEQLGSVEVLAFAQFSIPDPEAARSTIFALEGVYSSISIEVPPGAWPSDLTTGPSAAVFTPPVSRRRAAGQFVVGPYVSFGPPNVTFKMPIRISCPFNLTGIDEGNLEIRVHKFDPVTTSFAPQPYPLIQDGTPNVDRVNRKVYTSVTKFDPPYVAVATRILVVTTPTPTGAKPNKGTTTSSEKEEGAASGSLWYVGLGVGMSMALLATTGYAFKHRAEFATRKTKGKTSPEVKEDNTHKKQDKMEVAADVLVVGPEDVEIVERSGMRTPASSLRAKTKKKPQKKSETESELNSEMVFEEAAM